jgi:histone-arginine methyltransferase CARM1
MVDVIVSEPIGVLLVHERMNESFLYARDRYLKPGGLLMPASGTVFLAPVPLYLFDYSVQ